MIFRVANFILSLILLLLLFVDWVKCVNVYLFPTHSNAEREKISNKLDDDKKYIYMNATTDFMQQKEIWVRVKKEKCKKHEKLVRKSSLLPLLLLVMLLLLLLLWLLWQLRLFHLLVFVMQFHRQRYYVDTIHQIKETNAVFRTTKKI